jgi:DNA-binding NarL/FixJ family response regulator
MSEALRILIADDHPLMRQGLRQVIEGEPGWQVVGEAGNGREALRMLRQLTPQVAILDINMPELDGFAVLQQLRGQELATEIIFLTIHSEEAFLHQALNLGARGYVIKNGAVAEIVLAIRAVMSGQHYASPAMTSYLINRARASAAAPQQASLHDLTPTERRVLKLLAEYKTSREIAGELFISYRTVQTHRGNICQKLNIQGNHALMKFALAHQAEL